jgi:DNA polymerase
MLWLDYESKSECDLISRGSYNYAQHASTKMLCAAYAFDDEEVALWWGHEPVPERIAKYFATGGEIRCHNASFDRLITWYVVCQDYGLPEPALERWYCTAAQARANCLPGSLEDVGRAISSSMRKDHRGKQLVRQCCLPPFSQDPAILHELGEYAKQDVRAMRAISKAMRPLSDEELADYHTNERINDRGVLLDLPLAQAAIRYASVELEEIETLVADLTEGAIKSVRSPKMKSWVMERVGSQALKMMETYKDGDLKYSIDKSVRANLLVFAEENHEEIPAHVADVIQCADDLWASSVAKFSRLAGLADEDDHRVRGAFVFAGGSATGRASSYGAQLHNMSRKCAEDPDAVRHAMVRGHSITPRFGKRATDVLKGMLRPALIAAPGKVFVGYDWSAIEARMTPWLSADPQADEVLQVFRDGRDIYKREAAGIYRVAEDSVDKDQRQIGKVAILSLGFGGSIGAFSAMGRNYGVVLPESDSRRIVDAWRRANAWAVRYWTKLEEAYTRALRNPGREFTAGRVTYLYDKQHLWYALPSGRILCYPFAKFEGDEITYVKAAWKPAADAKEWPRARLWRGLATENITQAAAHDLLRESLRIADAEGLCPVAHVHDEILVECDAGDAERVSARLHEIMTTNPAWAPELPLAAEGSIMLRYGK